MHDERNGKGKEFIYDSNLKFNYIFVGEFLNGVKNGYGKECKDNKSVFEGEYLNGERNGKGKEYRNEELAYDGEYLNEKDMEKENNILIIY